MITLPVVRLTTASCTCVESAITGGASRLPYYATANNRTLPTEMSMVVGTCYMQLIPEQPAGIKLTNVGEDRTYSDSTYS